MLLLLLLLLLLLCHNRCTFVLWLKIKHLKEFSSPWLVLNSFIEFLGQGEQHTELAFLPSPIWAHFILKLNDPVGFKLCIKNIYLAMAILSKLLWFMTKQKPFPYLTNFQQVMYLIYKKIILTTNALAFLNKVLSMIWFYVPQLVMEGLLPVRFFLLTGPNEVITQA